MVMMYFGYHSYCMHWLPKLQSTLATMVTVYICYHGYIVHWLPWLQCKFVTMVITKMSGA